MENSNINEDFSSIKKIEKVVHFALPMSHISNEKAGVVEVLDSWIRQYNQQLEAILVGYDSVSLLSRRNCVVIDKMFIQVEVKANFHVFCPKVGDIAKGKINRISKELIGCLMHDTINVFIRLSDCCTQEFNKYIRLDQEILFEISHFNRQKKEVRVQGKITEHCLQLMTELFPVVEEDYLTNLSFTGQNTITQYDLFDDVDHNLHETTHPLQKDNTFSTVNGMDVSLTSDVKPEILNREKKSKKRKRDGDENMIDSNIPPTKKSKKLKHKLDSTNIVESTSQISDFIFMTTDSSMNFKSDDSDLSGQSNSTELNEEPVPVAKKKKSSSDKKSSKKKKKKDKKNEMSSKKKKEKLSSKKNTIVACGSVLKIDKKNKKNKHSKKTDSEKKSKKGTKEKKSKHKKTIPNGIEIKSED